MIKADTVGVAASGALMVITAIFTVIGAVGDTQARMPVSALVQQTPVAVDVEQAVLEQATPAFNTEARLMIDEVLNHNLG